MDHPAQPGSEPAPALSPIAQLLQEQIEAPPPAPASEPAIESAPRSVVTSIDPRLEVAAKSIETGDWRKVAADLGPLDQAGALPPTLGLLDALAHHEAAGDEAVQQANELAIRCVAAIFGVPADSPLPLVVAKRLLRKNPVAWRARPAPPARTSLLIIATTLLVGSTLGWFFSAHVNIRLHF